MEFNFATPALWYRSDGWTFYKADIFFPVFLQAHGSSRSRVQDRGIISSGLNSFIRLEFAVDAEFSVVNSLGFT
jgi:hypothetical protein